MPAPPVPKSPPDHGAASLPTGALRRLRDTLAFYAVLAVLAVGFFGWSLLATPLALLLPPRAGHALGRRAISGGFRGMLNLMQWAGIVRLDLAELDALRNLRGVVVAPNHLSLIDVMLIVSHLPDAVCIMKAGLGGNPMLGGGRLAGYIPNDAPLALVRRAAAELREGANLLIFPEGTRSPDGRLGSFHPGFALIARHAGAPVQTVFLESNTRYLGKGWPIWRRPEFPLTYRARLGGRFVVEGSAEAFSERLRQHYAAALGNALG